MSNDDHQNGYRYSYSVDDSDQPSIAVVEAVAELTNRDFRDLNPLHSAVDTAFLNGLFEEIGGRDYQSGSDSSDGIRSITFGYEGYEVTVEKEFVHVKPT